MLPHETSRMATARGAAFTEGNTMRQTSNAKKFLPLLAAKKPSPKNSGIFSDVNGRPTAQKMDPSMASSTNDRNREKAIHGDDRGKPITGGKYGGVAGGKALKKYAC